MVQARLFLQLSTPIVVRLCVLRYKGWLEEPHPPDVADLCRADDLRVQACEFGEDEYECAPHSCSESLVFGGDGQDAFVVAVFQQDLLKLDNVAVLPAERLNLTRPGVRLDSIEQLLWRRIVFEEHPRLSRCRCPCSCVSARLRTPASMASTAELRRLLLADVCEARTQRSRQLLARRRRRRHLRRLKLQPFLRFKLNANCRRSKSTTTLSCVRCTFVACRIRASVVLFSRSGSQEDEQRLASNI